jgi:hypothetical protein
MIPLRRLKTIITPAGVRFVSQISTGIIQLNIDELLLVGAYFLILILLRRNVIEYSIA